MRTKPYIVNDNSINGFFGRYHFLSNFYQQDFVYLNRTWPSAEHAYQAMKSTSFIKQEQIRTKASHPSRAKGVGRDLDLRSDWDTIRIYIMRTVLKEKFTDPVLKKQLIQTDGKHLVEGNEWGDDFWGIPEKGHGNGRNMLGKLLMNLRDHFS